MSRGLSEGADSSASSAPHVEGLQLLMTERPMAAFKCFQQCIPAFRTWPRLWLRLQPLKFHSSA
eukprot:6237290-Amphidinium_carterae.1